jgi:hypothetical protein
MTVQACPLSRLAEGGRASGNLSCRNNRGQHYGPFGRDQGAQQPDTGRPEEPGQTGCHADTVGSGRGQGEGQGLPDALQRCSPPGPGHQVRERHHRGASFTAPACAGWPAERHDPFSGGDAIAGPNGSCTSEPTVIGNNSGNTFMLTAGHCELLGFPVITHGVTMGAVTNVRDCNQCIDSETVSGNYSATGRSRQRQQPAVAGGRFAVRYARPECGLARNRRRLRHR